METKTLLKQVKRLTKRGYDYDLSYYCLSNIETKTLSYYAGKLLKNWNAEEMHLLEECIKKARFCSKREFFISLPKKYHAKALEIAETVKYPSLISFEIIGMPNENSIMEIISKICFKMYELFDDDYDHEIADIISSYRSFDDLEKYVMFMLKSYYSSSTHLVENVKYFCKNKIAYDNAETYDFDACEYMGDHSFFYKTAMTNETSNSDKLSDHPLSQEMNRIIEKEICDDIVMKAKDDIYSWEVIKNSKSVCFVIHVGKFIHAQKGYYKIYFNMKYNKTFKLFFNSNDTVLLYNAQTRKTFSAYAEEVLHFADHIPPLNDLINKFTEKNPIFKDVIKAHKEGRIVPPIAFSDLKNTYTPNDYFANRYQNFPQEINANKKGINNAYLMMTTYSHILKSSIPVLLNSKTSITFDAKMTKRQYTVSFIQKIFCDRLDKDPCSDEGNIIYDYINMAYTLHKRINLRSGYNAIKKLHDEYSDLMLIKETHINLNPESPSCFDFLAHSLPQNEFVWIRTNRKLIEEGREQHNCVVSYIENIFCDQSAIFSALINKTRYTIEIKQNGKKYYIEQMFKKYNEEADHEDFMYVNSLVEKANKGRRKNMSTTRD